MTMFYGGVNRRTVDAVTSRPFGSPAARAWFVDATVGVDTNAGNAEAPFLTIGKAITSGTASVGDEVIIGPGTYTITTAIIPLATMGFRAGVMRSPRHPTVTITGAVDLIEVDASDVQFEGIEFKASADAVASLVDVADTATVTGLSFVNCVFNGADKASVVGINAADATYIPTCLHVENCLFRDLTGTGINIGVLGFAYSLITGNQFAIDINSGVGIALADTSAFATGKGYAIVNNWFTGFDATADEVGITIAGTENTTGAGIIARNHFAYLAAAAVTIDKLSLSEVQNYYGDAATGGTLVDPGT